MARDARVANEREDGGREVSGVPGPFSVGVMDPDTNWGMGGIDGSSAGDRRPLRVVDLAPVLIENRPFAFGAEATRRMNRDADALMLRGESGACRADGELGRGMECWDELAVVGLDVESTPTPRCLSCLLCECATLFNAFEDVERETQGEVEGVWEPRGAREPRR